MKNLTNKEFVPVIYGDKPVRALYVDVGADFLCFSAHWHERIELLRIREGSLNLKRGEDDVVLKGGEMGIICSEQLHKGVSGKSGTKYDVLMFDVNYFLNSTVPSFKYLEPLVNLTAIFDIKTDNERIVECFDKIYAMCKDKESHPLLLIAAVYEILGLLYENCLLNFKETPTPSDIKFGKVIKYVNENFCERISVESISQMFGYNKSYFCRKFKTVTGTNIMNYILILRLEKSLKMLKESEESIASIAEICGFGDFPYFCRSFKKHYGKTPREYRKSASKEKPVKVVNL
ncbi:MAG: helix-turn-helix transcriptional regulator [Clostridia bacterium]|nr:helix-turn-helix transcriptional regulator [Clostridia bacterium]